MFKYMRNNCSMYIAIIYIFIGALLVIADYYDNDMISALVCLALGLSFFLNKIFKKKFINDFWPEVKTLSLSFLYFYFVYSTFLGQNKWLGKSFFYLFTQTYLIYIPLAIFLCLLSIGYILLVGYFLRGYLNRKNIVAICLGTTIFCGVVWYPLSFISYYSGVEARMKETSFLLNEISETVLKSDSLDEREKKTALEKFYGNVKMRAVLEKDGVAYVKADFKRSKIEENKDRKGELIVRGEFESNGNKYVYRSSAIYRPDLNWGIVRALTWSLIPDCLEGIFSKQKLDIDIYSNFAYVSREKAGRSMNWWLIFTATYGLACIGLFEYNKIKQKLKDKEKEMEEQYKNTGLYQELLFKQLMVEFNDIITSGAKNSLQVLIDSDNSKKKVYTEKGLQGAVSAIGDAVNDEIHRLKNKWNSLGLEGEKNKFIVDTILDDIRKLNRVFNIEYKDTNISKVEEIVRDSIPENYLNPQDDFTDLDFSFTHLSDSDINENDFIQINPDRLSSIVQNLLKNSDRATLNYSINAFDEEEILSYERKMMLCTGIEYENEQKYYTICVKDTGGGFPDEYIGKIYEEPVETTDPLRKGQKGSGTVYIGMFVKRMNGKIKAENYIGDNNERGAITKIYLPIKSKK